jgi:hypothetical protein
VSSPNVAILETAVSRLGPLLDELVFTGGCTTGLFITDPGAAEVRATIDADAIVEVASYARLTSFEDRLRGLGFHEDTSEGAPRCRWLHGSLILDVMPTDEAILGFTNRWFPSAVATSERRVIAGREIRVVTPVHFIATKLEAFRDRGDGDYWASRDIEDVITVVDGRPEIVEDAKAAPTDVQAYVAAQLRELLETDAFRDALPGYLPPDSASQARLPLLLRRLRTVVGVTDSR